MTVDIVTAKRKLGEGMPADSVVLPGAKGELEILPGHDELLTILGTGTMKIGKGTSSRTFAVSYGFAEIREDRILVLAETCEESSEIDVERAKKAQKNAENKLAAGLAPDDFNKYELKLHRAMVRQSAAKH